MKMGKKTGRRRKNDLITFSYRRIKTGFEYDFDLFVEGKADLHFMISFKRYIFVKERPCKPNVK